MSKAHRGDRRSAAVMARGGGGPACAALRRKYRREPYRRRRRRYGACRAGARRGVSVGRAARRVRRCGHARARHQRPPTLKVQCSINSSFSHCLFMFLSHFFFFFLLENQFRELTDSELCACSRVYERTASSTRGSGIRRQNGGERIEYHIQKQSRNSMQAPIIAERKYSPSPPLVGHTPTQSVEKVRGTHAEKVRSCLLTTI